MKYLAIAFTAFIISASAFAEPKLIVCTSMMTEERGSCEVGDIFRTQHFLVDTDDFSKEKPEYEYQLVYTCNEKADDFDVVTVLGASQRTITGYQQKYRYTYAVTPTTLSFHFDLFPSGHMDSSWQNVNINRETLTTESGTCTIEDVILKNKI